MSNFRYTLQSKELIPITKFEYEDSDYDKIEFTLDLHGRLNIEIIGSYEIIIEHKDIEEFIEAIQRLK